MLEGTRQRELVGGNLGALGICLRALTKNARDLVKPSCFGINLRTKWTEIEDDCPFAFNVAAI